MDARSSSVRVSPVSRKRVAPRDKRVLSKRMPEPAVAASSTFSASEITSGPIPSPGMTASFTTRVSCARDILLLRPCQRTGGSGWASTEERRMPRVEAPARQGGGSLLGGLRLRAPAQGEGGDDRRDHD